MVRCCIDVDIKSIFSRQTGCLKNSAPYNINRDQSSAADTFFKNALYGSEKIRIPGTAPEAHLIQKLSKTYFDEMSGAKTSMGKATERKVLSKLSTS